MTKQHIETAVEKGETVMTEYIDRELLLRDIEHYNVSDGAFQHWVEIQRAADVAPVRHERWIFGKDLPYGWGQILKNKYHLYCSECLEQAFNRSEDNDPDFDVDTPYCPFCGCCMDGGAD